MSSPTRPRHHFDSSFNIFHHFLHLINWFIPKLDDEFKNKERKCSDCISSLKPCTSLFLDTGSLNRQWRSIKHTSEPEHDKSRSRINIQTLGIGYGALCKQSQLSSCDHDSSFLAANILETVRKLRLVEVHLERYATVIV